MKNSNSWHKQMYGEQFIGGTIGNPQWKARSQKEVDFLLEKLSFEKGAEILDVPCGAGRLSVLFAKRGYKVLGIDINTRCVRLAKEKNSHKNVSYRVGNMIDLSRYRKKYDIVTNVFTSFGYFATDRENERVFKQMRNCLRPGGALAMGIIDRDWVLEVLSSYNVHELPKSRLYNFREYEEDTKYINGYFLSIDKKTKVAEECYYRHRLYSKPEIIALYKKNGFKTVDVFGGFDGSKFVKKTSHHPVYIGRL